MAEVESLNWMDLHQVPCSVCRAPQYAICWNILHRRQYEYPCLERVTTAFFYKYGHKPTFEQGQTFRADLAKQHDAHVESNNK